MAKRTTSGEGFHSDPNPTPVIATPTVSRGHDLAHEDAMHTVAQASIQVIGRDLQNFRALIKGMVDARDNIPLRDEMARRANDETIHIHAVAEAASGYMLSDSERRSVTDTLSTINKEYAIAIRHAGYGGTPSVNIEDSKPELSGPVRNAFNDSLGAYHRTFEEAADHMRIILFAVEAATEQRILRNFSYSGIDVGLLTDKLAQIEMLVRDGAATSINLAKTTATTLVPPAIIIAPVSREGMDSGEPTPTVPTSIVRSQHATAQYPVTKARQQQAAAPSGPAIRQLPSDVVQIPAEETGDKFLRDVYKMFKERPANEDLILSYDDIVTAAHKAKFLKENQFEVLLEGTTIRIKSAVDPDKQEA